MSKTKKTTEISTILKERDVNYGNFSEQANITMQLKVAIWDHLEKHHRLGDITADQLESLHMICAKIGRIVNGNANYIDSWIDIAGYAKLVSDRLEKDLSENSNR